VPTQTLTKEERRAPPRSRPSASPTEQAELRAAVERYAKRARRLKIHVVAGQVHGGGRRHRPHLFLLGIDLNELAAGRPRRHQGGTLIPYPDFSIRRTLIYATLALRLARRQERGVVGTLDRTCELDA
jgi:hypothetical protein